MVERTPSHWEKHKINKKSIIIIAFKFVKVYKDMAICPVTRKLCSGLVAVNHFYFFKGIWNKSFEVNFWWFRTVNVSLKLGKCKYLQLEVVGLGSRLIFNQRPKRLSNINNNAHSILAMESIWHWSCFGEIYRCILFMWNVFCICSKGCRYEFLRYWRRDHSAQGRLHGAAWTWT